MEFTRFIMSLTNLLVLCSFMLAINTEVINAVSSLPCQPRPVVLETSKYHEYPGMLVPEHVEVYRCSGKDESYAETNRCVASKSTELTITLEPKYSFYAMQTESITVVNHTECAMKCVCEFNGETCANGPAKVTCENGLTWDVNSCQCKIPCAITGTQNNPNDDKEATITMTVFVIVVIAEFIIVAMVTFFVLDACKYKKHSKGVIYRTTQYVRSLSVSDKDNFITSTLKRNRTETGSVSFLYDVNQDNNSNYKAKEMPVNI